MAISHETTEERYTPQATGEGGDGALEELPVTLPERDVRRKRPPALSFILRLDTLRRGGRVLSLLVLDYVGIFSAILLALSVKAAILTPGTPISAQIDGTQEIAPFSYLLTVLLFARSGLYGERSTRPG
ncbi:MAG: hypothetical protein H0X56_07875, partial [Solirubrobacterales bacterium]|nr:hypothetical protein [Solirubrobacterales bacterium]